LQDDCRWTQCRCNLHRIICYHTTNAAHAILREGFRDATGGYLFTAIELTGVWLGDSPMTVNEGATGEEVLQIVFPDDVDLSDYEIVEEQKPYREWCVPAELINTHAVVTLMSIEELDELNDRLFRERLMRQKDRRPGR
jgi:hypothetical protein